MAPHGTKVYPICDANRYFFYGNTKCSDLTNRIQYTHMQMICSIDNNQCDCSYSSYAKGLIACTIIAACTLGISFILIFSHILINQFNYKIHLYISLITIILLILGFIFILITLILLGATLAYDLFQYRYNLDYQLASSSMFYRKLFINIILFCFSSLDVIRKNITDLAYNEYDVRLDRGGILEIVALILSSFTLFTQIFYLLFIYRNRMG